MYSHLLLTSYAKLFKNKNNNNPREFEFQMSHLCPLEIDKTTFPADELFYKGKLLPLHLPPRLLMVQKLITPLTKNSTAHLYSHRNVYYSGDDGGGREEEILEQETEIIEHTIDCSDELRVADEGSILRYSRAERPKKKSSGSVPGRRAIAHRTCEEFEQKVIDYRSSRGLMKSDSVRCQHQELQWQMIENGLRCLEVN
ncbi:LOW QUALITY PROTEIN: hypothetical protein HID58_077170 [Brassica napus]|uniref:Uncharacterized protein n=1 Tax=Brassica napus TaxID=3708 RepID=A0ABQ7YS99_BRANA|nr:LOW QUALITY PROTEIN: hypothetical protein HID58_077170 [Brassica napus]